MTRALPLVGRSVGLRIPRPEVVRIGEETVLARWMEAAIAHDGSCVLRTSASGAVRVAETAVRHGIDVSGGVMLVAGEHDKLTGGGMALLGGEFDDAVAACIERVGGGPSGYQFWERSDDAGATRLVLAVTPELEIDEQQFAASVLEELRRRAPAGTLVAEIWRSGDTLELTRVRPEPSAALKTAAFVPNTRS